MRKGRQERRGNLPQSNLPLNHCTIPPSLKPPPPDPRFPRLFPEASCPIGVFPWGELVLGWGASTGTQEKQWSRRGGAHPPCRAAHSALPRGPRCAGPRLRAAPRTSSRRRRCSTRRCASSASRARRAAATTARRRTAWACPPSSLSAWTCSVSRGRGACPRVLWLSGRRGVERRLEKRHLRGRG